MKKIEENLIELLDVFDGNGIPNNTWVKDKLEETLILVKNCSISDVIGRSGQLPNSHCTLNRNTCGKGNGCKYPHCHL